MRSRYTSLVLALALLWPAPAAQAAGHWILGGPVALLSSIRRMADQRDPRPEPEPAVPAAPVEASGPARTLEVRDHRVNVSLLDGFARTEVAQIWHNPNPRAYEARYALPLPKNASLSEMTIRAGDLVLNGEVRGKGEAEQIYQEEKAKGNDAGIAKKDEYRNFEFAVARVLPDSDVEVRFVYYQPLAVDTGVARYVYPQEHGGNEEAGASFWQGNVQSHVPVKLSATVRTSWSVDDVRLPGLEKTAKVERQGEGRLKVEAISPDDRDLVLYYRLRTDLPGRVEVLAYNAGKGKPGTFMAVLTPGGDLPPIRQGADHVFVLDVSGSMRERLPVLVEGVCRAIAGLTPQDRFQVATFADRPSELTHGVMHGTPEDIASVTTQLRELRAGGGTDLYAGLDYGLRIADPERVTNLILVTDGVANEGALEPSAYRQLLRRADVRLHGFLMGQQANWPLMDTIARASGGHYQCVSNADDIVGLLALSRQKLTSEAIHDLSVRVDGVQVDRMTSAPARIYHGEQVIVFGRYERPGPARLTMTATIAGKPHTYTTEFTLPAIAREVPEVERLWGMARSEELKQLSDAGLMDGAAAKQEIQRTALEAQVVTDETAMVLLTDGQFASRGIERANEARVAEEASAQAARVETPAPSYRVDTARPAFADPVQPAAPAPAPNVAAPRSYEYSGGGHSWGHGGGALDPITGLMVLALAGLSMSRREGDA